MRFSLIDKIVEIDPGRSILAEKYLDGSEDYLADHFPNFACMPGVLMLESLYQAAAWLLRQHDNFARPIVMLKEARNVKYGNFVQPGQTLVVSVQLMKQLDETTFKLKGQGTVDGKPAVSGQLVLEHFLVSQRFGLLEMADASARWEYTKKFQQLFESAAVQTV